MKSANLVKKSGTLQSVALFALVLAWPAQSHAAPIVYQGIDLGATSLATAPNSTTASAAFDLAAGPLTILDFDTNLSGATLSPGSAPQGCGFALCGGNTTTGGTNFYGHVYTTTITFNDPINAFGAYFSGWQRQIQTLTYTDGTTVTLDMPPGDIGAGGMVFFGFIDTAVSISSITFNTVDGDFIAIDDLRFGIAQATAPEPASLALLGLALAAGLGRIRRKSHVG